MNTDDEDDTEFVELNTRLLLRIIIACEGIAQSYLMEIAMEHTDCSEGEFWGTWFPLIRSGLVKKQTNHVDGLWVATKMGHLRARG